jgi:putative membrane protein
VNPRQVFSDADLAAIQAAAVDAERTSAGEVVPYIVGRCHDYPEAAWSGAAFGAVTLAVIAAVVDLWVGPWGRYGPEWIALPPLAGVLLGYFLGSRVPAVARRLVPASAMAQHARLRAEAAFVEESVFDTRDRSGVLLLISLFERQAVLLADEGARAVVQPDEWATVVDALTARLHSGNPTLALVEAIAACAELLGRLPRREGDSNELRDEVRLRDR